MWTGPKSGCSGRKILEESKRHLSAKYFSDCLWYVVYTRFHFSTNVQILISSFFPRQKSHFLQCDSWKHTVLWTQQHRSQSVRIQEWLVELINKSSVSILTQNLTFILHSTWFCLSKCTWTARAFWRNLIVYAAQSSNSLTTLSTRREKHCQGNPRN